jgi:hypothetical protein
MEAFLGQAEIRQFDVASRIQQNILWFQVANKP